jgi:sigma-B regulation protein RsbU (phosphoserine phosphatase)
VAAAVSSVNRELARDNERAMFVTVFAARLDLATGELEYVNAGHNPTYRLGASGCAPLGGPVHPALGALEDYAYRAERLRLAPGDALLLYTDGVVEARSARDEEFQPLRLEAYLHEARDATPEALVSGLVERVFEFAGEAPQYDDVTVLALRWRPPASPGV